MPIDHRCICIHGHFYQPPRENAWLETVETQDGAAPYHDWNDRITAECYAPNGASRIVNGKNQIIRILNNYARMSFNFGPTLLSWLEENAPRTYRMILEADAYSQKRFSGHGSALAQGYNHMIFPLANTRDRITQIRWGIADFEHRFGRKPEGMWLPETAVDNETLDLLAENGILFTILAPGQCARTRPLAGPKPAAKAKAGASAEPDWVETPDASVQTTRPYLIRLKSGRSITVFFYDGPRSRAIAFEGLLNSGENFAARLASGFSEEAEEPELVHVATDGESYGHHHRHGEMALSYALHWIEQNELARLTNYGEFLGAHPPTHEAQIHENTSWSCQHGIERWRSNCGCNGGHPGWKQEWRAPLRAALDWLRDTLAPLTEELGRSFFKDVWQARNGYIAVVLDRSRESVERFFAEYASHELPAAERVTALHLMELQRHAQLMYTSCGWFFDDLAGIETVQVIAYASRALQLAAEIFGPQHAGLEEEFLNRLSLARSNDPAEGSGRDIYMSKVKRMQVGLEQVGAHYAISSVFGSYPEQTRLFCYDVRRLSYEIFTSGRGRAAIGRAEISSHITEETESVSFAVLHFGDQNITAAVNRYNPETDEPAFHEFLNNVQASVMKADFPEVIRLLDRHFGRVAYSLTSLFKDEQRRILQLILNSTLWEVENSLCTIYEDHASLLHFLSQTGLPKPQALSLAAGFAVNAGLRRALESDPIDAVQIRSLLGLAQADQIALDQHLLGYMADQKMKRAMVQVHLNPLDLEAVDSALLVAKTLRELPFELNLWQAQNIWYDTLRSSRAAVEELPEAERARWTSSFNELGVCLYIVVDELIVEEEPAIAVVANGRQR